MLVAETQTTQTSHFPTEAGQAFPDVVVPRLGLTSRRGRALGFPACRVRRMLPEQLDATQRQESGPGCRGGLCGACLVCDPCPDPPRLCLPLPPSARKAGQGEEVLHTTLPAPSLP